ncbi:MAG TPA: Tn3 family transposase [Stellaceae bacterium]|nr:Tn3 family transposase [Stellaceae bacterium]
MRRQQLSEAQITALLDPPTDQRELGRHYTLSAADLAAIRRCRGDCNRLGHALMLCYLRYPGRPLKAGERPPRPLLSFIAEQIDALPEAIEDYLAAERNRRRHAAELQDRLGFRPFGTRPAADLAGWLLPHAIETDRLAHLAGLVVEECRRRRIVVPSPGALERLCVQARYQARGEVQRRLTDGLSADQRRRLDALTQHRAETNQSWLAWLRQMPEAAKPVAMLGLIERLDHVRAAGLDPARGHRVHQARLAQLAREAGRTTVQHVAGYERQRRHAILVAVALDLSASLTDQAVDLFDRLIGTMFRKANERHARAFQADGRAINEKVRLYARVGAALIAARDNKQDAFDAITAVIPWDRFLATVAEAMTLARSEEFDAYQMLGEHYAGIRRWAPAFLDAFVFQSVPAAAALMRAIDTLRDMNRRAVPSLPKSAPISFIRERWARHVLRAGGIDRRYYELCVLSELRDRLRAGDVWVVGSRRYRAFEERLISRETLKELEQGGTLPIAVDADFERFISARRARLNERLAAIDVKAKGGLLPDVMIEKGVLKITPIEKSTPPEAEALAARLYAMLPRIRITDLLSEVARWTLFTDCFTHLRTGETAADPRILMASLLADGLNLGLTRMAEACSIASLRQLAWTADWHIRDETYALALRRLIDQQQREPLAAMFGSGFASSSDGQFFRAGGFGRDASSINAHYGDEPGVKFYTHLSDRYAPFHTKVIAATASEAAHVLDGLLYHQSEVVARRHHTDGGGDSDHVFALCSLLGFQFAPRIPDLKSRRLYSFGKASAYPSLEPLIAGRINVALIRAHWSEILRVAASIRTGTVTASLILRQLASYPRQNGLAAALRELGRLERTLFTLDWLEDRELRRQTGQELNKGETRNSLARAVFIHRLGEIRDRTYENQQHRASGLNLLVTAIILWNTRYLERAIAALRQAEDVPDQLLAHLSPLGWEHVNLTGDYIWSAERPATENSDGFHPLRAAPDAARKAA